MPTEHFHVFLCHNSRDKAAVARIGKQLQRRGLRPWLDQWELRPGLPWQRTLEEQIETIGSVAVFVGEAGIGPWQNLEIDAFIRSFVKRGVPVIPVILPTCKDVPKLPVFLEGMMYVDFRKQRPVPIEQLVWGITGIRETALPGLDTLQATNSAARATSSLELQEIADARAQAESKVVEWLHLFMKNLIPSEPLDLHGWRVEGRFRPSAQYGGDFYFVADDNAGGVVVAIAEVTGHGISAAFYACMMRATLNAIRRCDPEPGPVARDLLAAADFLEGRRYATLVYVRLLGDGTLRYFNAGHMPVLVLRADGRSENLSTTGPIMMRLLALPPIRVEERRLEPGDRLLLYTDGLAEAIDPQDEEFGIERVRETFLAARALSPEETLDTLLRQLEAHGQGRPLGDDVTLVLVERVG